MQYAIAKNSGTNFGIGFDEHGYFFEPWSPLKGQRIRLECPTWAKPFHVSSVSDLAKTEYVRSYGLRPGSAYRLHSSGYANRP